MRLVTCPCKECSPLVKGGQGREYTGAVVVAVGMASWVAFLLWVWARS